MNADMSEMRATMKMNRAARKEMADSRALEEQKERENPLSGSGATPSMGLSQVRGGKKMMSNASAQGKMLMEHLGSLHGSGYAKQFHEGMKGAGFFSNLGHGLSDVAGMFGLGKCDSDEKGGLHTGRYEGEGKMSGGFLGMMALALPLISKLLGAGKMSQEAHDQMKKMIEDHEKKHHSGKMSGGFLGMMALALPLISKLLGAGHMTKGAADQLKKMLKKGEMEGSGRAVGAGHCGGYKRSDFGKAFSREEEANMVFEPEDAASMARGPKKSMAMRLQPVRDQVNLSGMGTGAGRFSDLGHKVSDIAGMFGLGKKQKRVVGAGDGRRKRAEVVRKVMAEKGMKMIEASKYVKEHGLYKP